MTIKKWPPCPLWDMTGLQSWLNEEAAAGLVLEKWPHFSALSRVRFRQDPAAAGSRYCLDPISSPIAEAERQAHTENYAEHGWRYAGKVGQLYAIYRCDDPDAPPLFSDPDSLALAMKALMRRMWADLVVWLFWPVALFWDKWPLLLHHPAEFLMEMILRAEALIPFYLILLAWVILSLHRGIRTFLGIRRVQGCLRRGQWPPPGPRQYPERRYFRAGCTIVLLFILFLAGLGLSGGIQHTALAGPEDWDFPHVTLEEILPDGAVVLDAYGERELLHPNALVCSLLAPEQYDVAQGGMVSLPEDGTRETRLYQESVRAISPSLARAVYRGRVEAQRHALEDAQLHWTELSCPGLDALTRFAWQNPGEISPVTVYIGLAGERVFVLHCTGPTDADAALSLLTVRLTGTA